MKRPGLKDVLYVLAIAVMVGGTTVFLVAWMNHFRSKSPAVVVASPSVFREEIPFSCRLIWNEEVLRAPVDGTVSYPGGAGPRWVRKGEDLALFRAASGNRTVRAPDAGYFVAGLDGLEGSWDYLSLWKGEGALPVTGPLSMTPEGAKVTKGDAFGKFLPQPQDLRAVGYVDGTEEIIDEIHRGILEFRRDCLALPFTAEVRVARPMGWKRKVYLTFPVFPPAFLLERTLSLRLCLSTTEGVLVPEQALRQEGAVQGIFVVEGQNCLFRTVLGRPVGDGQYLVTRGLRAGEIVVADASEAREGKVQLW